MVKMSTTIEPIELQEFIATIMQHVENGIDIETRHIKDVVEFEISVERVSKKEGDIKVYVANGKAESSNSHIAKVKFSAYPRQSEREKAEIARVILENRNRIDEGYM